MSFSKDSIISKLEYTASLQKAYLPKKRHFDRLFKNSFQIYYPAEYLSGDFYWIAEKDGIKYLAVGDCTGHGVSAAFLSMLGYNFLNHALHNKNYINLDDILKEVDKQLIDAFSSTGTDQFDNDWIDMAIISYNETNEELCFSGANRKALIVTKDGNSKILKGEKYPLGGWQIEEKRDFPVQKLNISNCKIYVGSDGLQDQFSAEHNKRLGSKRLHKFLIENSGNNYIEQKELIVDYLKNWKGDNDQTDDICLISIEL